MRFRQIKFHIFSCDSAKNIMASHEIEIILSRQWADSLSIPVFLSDTEGNLIFYNRPAEAIFGKRFEDTGPLPQSEWSTMFNPRKTQDDSISPEEIALVRTLRTQEPAQGSLWIDSLDGEQHFLNVTSIPIIGMAGGNLGAIAIFWKNQEK